MRHQAVATLDDSRYFPDAILDATSVRGLINAIVAYADEAVVQFDAARRNPESPVGRSCR